MAFYFSDNFNKAANEVKKKAQTSARPDDMIKELLTAQNLN